MDRYDIASNCELVNCSFQLQKRTQDVIRTHNETLSIVAVCICNPDRSPV
jgi:hypothetical protein